MSEIKNRSDVQETKAAEASREAEPTVREAQEAADEYFGQLLDSENTRSGDTSPAEQKNSSDVKEPRVYPRMESKHGGGSYHEVKKYKYGPDHEKKPGVEEDIHHMPPNSVTDISRERGPCILMDKEDHRLCASSGCSRETMKYQAMQKKLCEEGKFREAFENDVKDIQSKFGDKYDDQIAEARAYIDKLENAGII